MRPKSARSHPLILDGTESSFAHVFLNLIFHPCCDCLRVCFYKHLSSETQILAPTQHPCWYFNLSQRKLQWNLGSVCFTWGVMGWRGHNCTSKHYCIRSYTCGDFTCGGNKEFLMQYYLHFYYIQALITLRWCITQQYITNCVFCLLMVLKYRRKRSHSKTVVNSQYIWI